MKPIFLAECHQETIDAHTKEAQTLAMDKKHQHWTTRQWEEVLWTDVSKFEIFGEAYILTNGSWRVEKSAVKPGGGSVMV
jgi:hypothetical protein